MARSEWGLGIRGLGLVYAYYSIIIIIICAYVLYLFFSPLVPPASSCSIRCFLIFLCVIIG